MFFIEALDDELYLSLITTSDPNETFSRCSVDGQKLNTLIVLDNFGETQRIGTEEVGFVDVPASWVKFTDIEAGDTVYQFSDPSAKNIITLYTVRAEEANYEGSMEDMALTLATNLVNEYESRDDVELTGTYTDDVSTLNGYWLTTEWNDGSVMYSYILAGDDRVYVCNIEGDANTVTYIDGLFYDSFSTDE